MTLLSSGDAASVDGRAATQALLVRSYLGRGRRRPVSLNQPQPPRALAPMGFLDPPATAALRCAMDFIDARAADPIGLTDIAAAAQLSPRAVQAAFRRHLHTTPLGHLRSVRLARAHADLLSARRGDGQTVTEVANRWGFSQLSRFARDYRRSYGVAPHQTLGSDQR